MKKFGILCAMAVEAELLRERCSDVTADTTIAGVPLMAGRLGGHEVVIATSGIGKVHAALATQLMIDRFGVEAVVNTGIAGGLEPSLRTLHLTAASDTVQHDFDLSPVGCTRGYVPGCGGSDDTPTRFVCDPALLAAFERAMRRFPESPYKIGTIASGDIFVASPALKAELTDRYGAIAAEMEGAAVAQVAHANGIPCFVLRAISDLADGDATMSYPAFEKAASRLSANVMITLLEEAD